MRVPELDGVRGVAILLVFLAHVFHGVSPFDRAAFDGSERWLSLGDITGVQLFFVLSGYLITAILLREHSRTSTIALGSFYLRRLRRLYPPLLVICGFFGLHVLAGRVLLAKGLGGLGDLALALTYTTNLTAAVRVPRTGWLGHTWSLAVEEQFYLVWPLLLLVGISRWGTRGLALLALAGVLFTAMFREFTTDLVDLLMLRWDALLLGALFALVEGRLRIGFVCSFVGWCGLLLLSCARPVALTNLHFLGSAVVCLVVVAGARNHAFLRWGWLRHLGHISYSLYLWHVLILRYAPPAWISVPASLLAAEVSFRLVERRFMANPP